MLKDTAHKDGYDAGVSPEHLVRNACIRVNAQREAEIEESMQFEEEQP